MRCFRLLAILCGFCVTAAWADFDHGHKAWDVLVKKHVVVQDGGRVSKVRYTGFKSDEGALKAYTDSLSKVPEGEFKAWNKPQQMAFLINAYNAFTVVKVLQRYPDLKSNTNFLALQSQLEGTENRITVARNDYNEAVRLYNTSLRTFPTVIWAKTFYGSQKPAQPFTAAASAQTAPTVSFDAPPAPAANTAPGSAPAPAP